MFKPTSGTWSWQAKQTNHLKIIIASQGPSHVLSHSRWPTRNGEPRVAPGSAGRTVPCLPLPPARS